MPIDFDNLPALFAGWADALSGRTSPVVAPPIVTTGWQYDDTVVTSPTYITLTMHAVGGTNYELRAPNPGATLLSLLQILSDHRWRRAPIQSYPAVNTLGRFVRNQASMAKLKLLQQWVQWVPAAVAPFTMDYEAAFLLDFRPLGKNLIVACYLPIHYVKDVGTIESGSGSGLLSPDASEVPGVVSGSGTLRLDLSAELLLQHERGGSFYLSTPQTPDSLEDFAILIQFGILDESLNVNEVAAINYLAEKMAAAAARGGKVTTHRDRPYFALGGEAVTLIGKTHTSDNALRRLAAAVRGYTAPDVTVWNELGAVAALNANVVVNPK